MALPEKALDVDDGPSRPALALRGRNPLLIESGRQPVGAGDAAARSLRRVGARALARASALARRTSAELSPAALARLVAEGVAPLRVAKPDAASLGRLGAARVRSEIISRSF